MSARAWMIAAIVLASVATLEPLAHAGLSEEYLRLWDDPALRKRVNDGIEKNRKSDAVVQIVGSDGQPIADANVKIRQVSHEFLFGCNAFVLGQLGDKNEKYETAFTQLFSFATVPFYWSGTEPKQGELRYQEGSLYMWRRPPLDRFQPFAKEHGITLKGHPLLWHEHNPAWLPKDPVKLKKLYQKRFREIAERYGKEIPIWDVVNESLLGGSRKFALFTPDREYVTWAFKEAAPLFPPDAMLMINDAFWYVPSMAYCRQIEGLKRSGVPVRGIGFQFHIWYKPDAMKHYLEGKSDSPGALLDAYDTFAKLGLPLYITEITVPTNVEDGEAAQARVIGDLYRLWFSAPRMAGITYWNLADGTAYESANRAQMGLLDEDMNPKPAYYVLDRLINQEWRTNLEAKTNAAGIVKLRGFHGRYQIEVIADGETKNFEMTIRSDGPAKAVLTMP